MAQPLTDNTAESFDYESLPPNFSLAQNMLAGAFAGIAVCRYPTKTSALRLVFTNAKLFAII
jgi:solute carrier family 25 iron transporter 28/37